MAIIERDAPPVTATATGARLSSGAFTVQPGTTQLRLQFYLNAPATFYPDDVQLATSLWRTWRVRPPGAAP